MKLLKHISTILFFLLLPFQAAAADFLLQGEVVESETDQPIAFASVLLKEINLWAITDEQGHFSIKDVAEGQHTLIVQCLGYARKIQTIMVGRDSKPLKIKLLEDNLKLEEVEVTAQRKADASTTSYTIDRLALDNQQILNLTDAASLLPGGQTVNGTLLKDSRFSLRSGSSEKGNASFGTAVEVDGMRMDNNAAMGETTGASTLTLSAANIENVEVVTGIASVEYGDLSNGVVKVNTRKGRSPFMVEGRVTQHTKQAALSKGFELNHQAGVLNFSVEHARSFSDIASPHTAYQRNALTMNYMNVFMRTTTPLTFNLSLSGNVGGYNSEADPDEMLDDYTRQHDNVFRASTSLKWLLNKPYVTNLELSGSFSYSDKQTEEYYSASSTSTQPYIHTREQGYFIATDYDVNPNANIILGPTGYWYVRAYNDTKPMSYSMKLKYEWTRRSGLILNKLLAGAEYTGSGNRGRGTYYEDMRYAPTWREYRYDELPWLRNLALYAEDHVSMNVGRLSRAELTLGMREDLTMISGSDYGTVSSFSPRGNARFVFWQDQDKWIEDLSMHAGWGKSVKLPSFQVLYPRTNYSDKLAFASTSTSDNTSYYCYFTYPSDALRNADLRWQYTNQTDIGIEMKVKGTRINISAFHHKTYNPYMATTVYTPYTYYYTSPTALQSSGIAAANRAYSVDRSTGIVTVSDLSGQHADVVLPQEARNTYVTNLRYVNASPINRWGLEWIIDFAQIKSLRTSLRIDGKFYQYKGTDETLFADIPLGVSTLQSDGQPFSYVGWYAGGSSTSTSYGANASVSNGALSKQVNTNFTISTHIPKARLIVALRVETCLLTYRRALCELSNGTRGYVLENTSDYFGEPYDGTSRDKYVAVYPIYYSTWDDPQTLIPFYEKFLWARDNDAALYNDLAKLVERSNYAYIFNPNRVSAYYSANLSVTKEIGRHVTVAFYANNFFNNLKRVHSSQTDLETSLFGSGYIPAFYYGLSLKLKI